MDLINIGCIYWTGGYFNLVEKRLINRCYMPDDVDRLAEIVRKNTAINYNFFCITNDRKLKLKNDCHYIKARDEWPGWWAKMNVFDPDNGLEGLVLYLDQDISIIGNLEKLIYYGDKRKFYLSRGKYRAKQDDAARGLNRKFHASVMRHYAQSAFTNEMFSRFCRNYEKLMQIYRGEQDLYGAWYSEKEIGVFPDDYVVKLNRAKFYNKKPKNTIIISGNNEGRGFRQPSIDWINK